MIDLISLVSENAELFPSTAEALIESVEDCVVYQVTGEYRAGSYGLASYFPYTYAEEQYDDYVGGAASLGTSDLYELLFRGSLSEEAAAFFTQEIMEIGSEAEVESEYEFADSSDYGFENHPVSVMEDEDWTYAVLETGAEAGELLQSVAFTLMAFHDDGMMTFLGEDSNVDADWENGVFTDLFTGTWGAIDGHTVSIVVSSITDGYVLYDVPILLNGEFCILTVAYLPDDGTYEILTATPETEGSLPSKTEYTLEPGDEVTTLFVMASEAVEDAEYYEGETFTITEDTTFEEETLPDGPYAMVFTMTDYAGQQFLSRPLGIVIEDGYPIISEVE
jgi:hypothetical protein